MTIVENKFLREIKDCELNLWDKEEQNEHVKECVKIADEYAIDFTEWVDKNINGKTYTEYKNGIISIKHILEIYKNQTEL